ncbi:hypothetical protein [Nocardioides sp. LHG3406-4]|uniref:hypothetical protein n=1 Tax=Nocardioides sp. LHG3406-4 TaxID=2804575 RepID=UPI003CEDF643
MTELIVPTRYCGPPSSGNGGWTAGALAALVDAERRGAPADAWPAIEVSLRRPPPLETEMAVTVRDGVTLALHDGATVAEARPVEAALETVEPVEVRLARAARAAYPGLRSHPFPTCFVCGTAREEGDGLRIFPGPVAPAGAATRVAATWTPHPSLAQDQPADPDDVRRTSLAVTWAALDCVGGWAGDLEERLMVLGRITAQVDTLPVVGDEHVVVGQARGREGRKTFTAAALYDPDGRVVARAEHVWIAIDPKDFA